MTPKMYIRTWKNEKYNDQGEGLMSQVSDNQKAIYET